MGGLNRAALKARGSNVRRLVKGALGCLCMALVLVSAACSSSPSTGEGSTAGGSTAGGASGGVIPIGTLGTFSGPQASSTGRLDQVMEAWAAYTNAHGGLNGQKVKLYVEDDGDNATAAITDAKALIDQDKVVAIVSDGSYSDTIWGQYAQQAGVPVVGGQSQFPPFQYNPDFFPSTAGSAAQSYGLMAVASKNGPDVATVYCAEAPVCKGVAAGNAQMGKLVGAKVVYSAFISASAADYTPECEAIKASGAQTMVVGVSADPLIKLVQECKNLGVTAKLVLGGPTANQTIIADPAIDNFLDVDFAFPYFDDSTPATQEFQAAIKQYANLGDQMGPYAAYMWSGGALFAAAVQASHEHTVTRQSVLAGLYALQKGTTLGGIAPPLSFVKGESRPQPINCYFVWGKQNGKLYEPQGLKSSCAPVAVVEQYNLANYK
jgi:branched-chain amino acid transport system substrate-binding protein